MNKFLIVIPPIIFNLIIISCNSEPTSPINTNIDKSVFSEIKIEQTDYTKFSISNNGNLIIPNGFVSKIILGTRSNGIFQGTDTLLASYTPQNNDYVLTFNFNSEIDDSLIEYNFTLRYLLFDESIYDLDTSMVTYKYPYESTEILIDKSKLHEPDGFDIQSFDIAANNIYYHPYGPWGLFEYDMKTDQTIVLYDHYAGGDQIAASENYVFCDVYHTQVYRYNLSTDTIDLTIDLSLYLNSGILGMEVYENKLYVLSDLGEMLIYNFDLQNEEMFPFPGLYGLTIADSIAYILFYNSREIARFSLITNMYLQSKKFPTSYTDALRIEGDKMYFTDLSKKIIGYLNLSEINN